MLILPCYRLRSEKLCEGLVNAGAKMRFLNQCYKALLPIIWHRVAYNASFQCLLSQRIHFVYFQIQNGRHFQNGHLFKTK